MNHSKAGVCTEALLRALASMGNTTACTVRDGARTEPRIIRGPVVGILANGVTIS